VEDVLGPDVTEAAPGTAIANRAGDEEGEDGDEAGEAEEPADAADMAPAEDAADMAEQEEQAEEQQAAEVCDARCCAACSSTKRPVIVDSILVDSGLRAGLRVRVSSNAKGSRPYEV
jgi:hypothetical protein